jgi:methanogenic corrinoid protein MtbC1
VTAFVHKRQYQASGPLPSGLPPGASELGEEALQYFQDAALRGDAAALVGQIAGLRLRGHSLSELFDELVAAALHRVGQKWAQSTLSVADEHVASQAVIDAVARSQPLAEAPGEPVRADRGTAVVAAVAGELHDIAARMAACLLRAQGFEVLAPLAQTPARDLADLILRSRAVLVALSSTINSDVADQVGMSVAAVRQTGGRLFVGGEGMRNAPLPEEATLLGSLRELEAESHSAGRKRTRI